jgi:tRNA (cmo5U34)-methyltransferase
MQKASAEEIRARFDSDVERFSNLEMGQSAIIDAPVMLELIAAAAAAVTPHAAALLDIGCGAGNYSLKLLQRLPGMAVTLVDLSRPMLDRAVERLGAAEAGPVEALQGDIRELDLGEERFDVVVAAAIFHHLREDAEWEAVFRKVYRSLRPGGSLWISDMVDHLPPVQALLWERYGEYLTGLRDAAYREHVFAYVSHEDTPRPLVWQLDMLRWCGFAEVEVLHKNGPFVAFGGVR